MHRLPSKAPVGGGGCTYLTHDRSRVVIDRRIPTYIQRWVRARHILTDQAELVCLKCEAS